MQFSDFSDVSDVSEGEKESNTDDRSVGKWDMVTNSSSSSLQNRFQNLENKSFQILKKKVFMLLGNDLGGQYVAEKKKNLKLTLNNN
jgi:hypothetical protein